ncbi:MAG: TRAM domain-containing protein, partial [Acidimicrobiales bacterium]
MSEPHVVGIEKLVAGGDGLARMDDGRVVFVPGVVAGERVEIDLVSKTNDFGHGRLLRVVEPSPDRRVPPCPHVA